MAPAAPEGPGAVGSLDPVTDEDYSSATGKLKLNYDLMSTFNKKYQPF